MTGGWTEGRGPQELVGGGSSDDAQVEVLGTGSATGGPASVPSGSDSGAGAGSRPLGLLIGGVLAVVALLVILGRPGEPEVADEEASPVTSVVPTTRPPAPTVPTTEPVVFDAPVLLERSGLTLFLGGVGPLQSLDLDSGRLTTYGVTAHPVVVTGEDLVVYQESVGIVGWVPLADPGQQALSWKQGQVALGTDPGRLWVLDPSIDEAHPAGADVGFGRWELFDTAANRRVLRVPGDLYDDLEAFAGAEPQIGGAFGALRPGPWLSTRRDGVYRAIEDGYTRLTGGRVLAIDDEAVLVEQCEIEGPCTVAWVDVETGGPVDRVLPEVRPREARLVAGGAWLHSVGWGGTSELLELATGRRIEHDWATARPAVSPDGRWLAHWSASGLVLTLLDEGGGEPPRQLVVEGIEHGESDSLLFAPTPRNRRGAGAARS